MSTSEFVPIPSNPTATKRILLDWMAEQSRVWECGARPGGGHLWRVEAEPGEKPALSCADCPATADDLVGDSCIYLEGEPYDIGGRIVDFATPLPADAEPYSIPVVARAVPDMTAAGPHGPAEVRTILITLTPREVTL